MTRLADLVVLRSWLVLAAGALCLMPQGCATYHAQPVQPGAFQAHFQKRSLTDAGLQKYILQQPIKEIPGFLRMQSLSTLVATGWYYSPALRVQWAQLAVDRTNMITASESPNPAVSLSPAYAAKAGPGISPWILGFNFDIPIETAGRRDDRMAQAAALTQAGRYDLGQSIRRALIDYQFSQKQILLLRQQVENTALIQSLIRSRFHAGDISHPVYTAAQIQARQAALTLVSARGLVRQRRIELAGAIFLPPA